MRRHISYGKYLLRHKYFVFRESLKLGVPLLAALIHDWDKLLPWMWIAYANTFYNEDGTARQSDESSPHPNYDYAWLAHQKRNKHHWQAWVIVMDGGDVKPLTMPERHIREMIADWRGAGKALGFPDTIAWYNKNKYKMYFDRLTRQRVEHLLMS
jgi:hypothetical protein